MKPRIVLCAGALGFALFSLGSVRAESGDGSSRGYYLPARAEELEGTWKAEGDPSAKTERKLVYYWWGYFEVFRFEGDEKPFARGTSTIVEKWVDDEGSVWYKEFFRVDSSSRAVYFRIIKLGDGARRWESVQSSIAFPSPEDLSSDDRFAMGYRAFRRHELEACCH